MRIIAATQNAHKLLEIKAFTEDLGVELLSQKEAGIGDIDIEETGTTFEENSYIKAEAICKITGEPAMADDSGLEVDFLDRAPGIFSARYAGEHGNDEANRKMLLKKLEGVPPEKRGAGFVCVITLLFPDGRKIVSRGECRGHIGFDEKGTFGFGYDPVFIPEGYNKTFAELGGEVKGRIGHRARAFAGLREQLKRFEP